LQKKDAKNHAELCVVLTQNTDYPDEESLFSVDEMVAREFTGVRY